MLKSIQRKITFLELRWVNSKMHPGRWIRLWVKTVNCALVHLLHIPFKRIHLVWFHCFVLQNGDDNYTGKVLQKGKFDNRLSSQCFLYIHFGSGTPCNSLSRLLQKSTLTGFRVWWWWYGCERLSLVGWCWHGWSSVTLGPGLCSVTLGPRLCSVALGPRLWSIALECRLGTITGLHWDVVVGLVLAPLVGLRLSGWGWLLGVLLRSGVNHSGVCGGSYHSCKQKQHRNRL